MCNDIAQISVWPLQKSVLSCSTAHTKPGRLVETCSGVQNLPRQHENGAILQIPTAKGSFEGWTLYQEHYLENFRAKFNKRKKQYFGFNEGTFQFFLVLFFISLLYLQYPKVLRMEMQRKIQSLCYPVFRQARNVFWMVVWPYGVLLTMFLLLQRTK